MSFNLDLFGSNSLASSHAQTDLRLFNMIIGFLKAENAAMLNRNPMAILAPVVPPLTGALDPAPALQPLPFNIKSESGDENAPRFLPPEPALQPLPFNIKSESELNKENAQRFSQPESPQSTSGISKSKTARKPAFQIDSLLFKVLKNDGVVVTLHEAEVWRKFHAVGTEMMVFNQGRRLFPTLQFKVTGLNPEKLYCVGIHLIPDSAHKQKYDNDLQKYVSCTDCKETIFAPTNEVVNEPMTGKVLMNIINLSNLKIYNIAKRKKTPQQMAKSKKPNAEKMIEVKMLHKYLPVVRIYEYADGVKTPIVQASFPETAFITVSMYKNKTMTEMKTIENKYCRVDIRNIALGIQNEKPTTCSSSDDAQGADGSGTGTGTDPNCTI